MWYLGFIHVPKVCLNEQVLTNCKAGKEGNMKWGKNGDKL